MRVKPCQRAAKLSLYKPVDYWVTEWIDVIEDEGDDDVDAIGLVRCDGVLIVVTRPLTILRQRLQRLSNLYTYDIIHSFIHSFIPFIHPFIHPFI